jgi:phage tail-like protein
MPPGVGLKTEPIIANRFELDLGFDKLGSLQEVSGLEDETEVVELQQVAKGGKVLLIKTQGAMPLKLGTLTVKYAAFKDDPLKKWFDDIVNGKVKENRKSISIHLLDFDAKPLLSFNFQEAWPTKYSFGGFTAKGNDPVSVTVTIQHEGMKVKGYNE